MRSSLRSGLGKLPAADQRWILLTLAPTIEAASAGVSFGSSNPSISERAANSSVMRNASLVDDAAIRRPPRAALNKPGKRCPRRWQPVNGREGRLYLQPPNLD